MKLEDHFMQKFIEAYELVHKKTPTITRSIRNKWHKVEGLGNAHPVTWSQIAIYYNWCHRRDKTPHKINKNVCDALQKWYDRKLLNKLAIAIILQVSPSNIRVNLKCCKTIHEAYKVTLERGTVDNPIIKNNGNAFTSEQWASHLGMSHPAFLGRIKKHGSKCYLTFLTKEEYAKIEREEKDRLSLPGCTSQYTCKTKIKVNTLEKIESLEYSQALNIVSAIIHDAKVNLIRNHKVYFRQSQLFLMNSNGQLQYLLEPIHGLNLKGALEELHNFAQYEYRSCVEDKGSIYNTRSGNRCIVSVEQ